VHFAARFFERLSSWQNFGFQDFIGNDLTNLVNRLSTWSNRSYQRGIADEAGRDDSSQHEEPQEEPQHDRLEVGDVKKQSQSSWSSELNVGELMHHVSRPELPGTPAVELDAEGLQVETASEEV